jgi:hypothetical protein
MGKEALCRVRFGGQEWTAKTHLEEDVITVRGEPRVKVALQRLASVEDGWLVLPSPDGELSLELGDEAPKWAHAIQNPRTLLDKLGLRAGQSIAVLGFPETDWLEGLPFSSALADSTYDVILRRIDTASGLDSLEPLRDALIERGMLWIVFPKGRTEITEMQIFAAGKALGLVDVKVCRFSATHTGLKFVRPKK